MKKRKKITIVSAAAVALVVTMCVVIIAGINMPKDSEIIQGMAETTDYRISSKIPARVLELRVCEGDRVKRGDTLVILEAPDILAKLQQAEAAVSAAQAQEQKALRGTRYEQVQQSFELWQKALAALDVTEKTYVRINRLYEEGVVSEQKRDEAKAQYEAAVASEKAARAQYDMAVNGTRSEDKDAAGAQVIAASGAVSEVSSYVDELILLAPADGEVTEIFPEVGELVGTGAPIMNISRVDDVWFTFNIREDLLPGLKPGAKTEVYLPAYDTTVVVRITKMKDVGSFAAWKATKALDGFDLRTFEVEARPVDTLNLTGVRSGMSAIIRRSEQ